MAFATGSANSIDDLILAITTACTANGWTLTGNILSKGGCFARLTKILSGAVNLVALRVGQGVDGSNVLTGDCGKDAIIGGLVSRATGVGFQYDVPFAYSIHVLTDPDEVYVLVNYSGPTGSGFWSHLCFGKASTPVGSGVWQSGFGYAREGTMLNTDGVWYDDYWGSLLESGGPFFVSRNGSGQWLGNLANSFIHAAINETTGLGMWSPGSRFYVGGGGIGAGVGCSPMLGYTPNKWNSQAVLFPVQIFQDRASTKLSLIAEITHMRYTRNDNYSDGDIITLGTDKWRIYPTYKKNTDEPGGRVNSQNMITHSGTIAMAVRYDGA